ncbi:MAG: NYN domain-containing protein [Chlorobiaceae bacterium]|nr:NYN domain-containing protein [Chlorobiaceae bacterium]
MEHSKETIAMLIDADNSPSDKIDFILAEMAKYGVVNIRRAYGNWKSRSLKGWEDKLHDYAIRPIQQFDYTKGKNATDMAMTIDAMDLLYSKKLDAFCIVSSDSDFTPLVMRILSEGLNVYGFGQKSTPSPFVNACSTFLYVDSLGVQEKAKNDGGRRKSGFELKNDSKLMTLIKIAVDSAQEEDGWSNLAKIGKNISNQASFDPRNYGYKRLSDLIRSIDLFEIEFRNNNSELYIRDRRKVRQPGGVTTDSSAIPTLTDLAVAVQRPLVQEPVTPKSSLPETVAPVPPVSRQEQPRPSAPPSTIVQKPVVTEFLSTKPSMLEVLEPVPPAPSPAPEQPEPAVAESVTQASAESEPTLAERVESVEDKPAKPSASRTSRSRSRSRNSRPAPSKPAPQEPTTEVTSRKDDVAAPLSAPYEPVSPAPEAESRPKRRPRRPAKKKTEISGE